MSVASPGLLPTATFARARAMPDEPVIIGCSPAMREILAGIHRLAHTDATVLITGESGVGKKLMASYLHAVSPRRDRPFVPVDCAALPETLLESELFGHVKGSVTGAYRDKPGRFERAHRGTLLLDEIGEMSPRMQGLLLRVLETGEFQHVGEDRGTSRADCRVIAVTNRDLPQMVEARAFREGRRVRPSVAERLFDRLKAGESFWTVVQARYMKREITRGDVQAVVRQALTEARGNYRIVTRLFNVAPGDYKRLLNFLRKHDCLLPYREFR